MKSLLIVFFAVSFLVSCEKVKPYQKMYLNMEEMKLSNPKIKVFDTNAQSYREGASGGNGGKAGGGCGCN